MVVATLSSAYFGPIQWFQKMNRADQCFVEQYDHFVKQTYRNRCIIATTQGLQALTVPIEKSSKEKQLMRDVRISMHGKWQQEHWNALQSAYGESPFFDYYVDDLYPFFHNRWEYLFDFNMAITEQMCKLLDVQATPVATTSYATGIDNDYRDVIRPKHPLPDEAFSPQPYYQVYRQKHGFQPNLSILDLLFNMGNEAILYL